MSEATPYLSSFTLMTSNAEKLAEFARFGIAGLSFAEGPDIEEVDGTPDEVVVHKSIASGAMTIVEDSIVLIEGRPMVDIRWKLDELAHLVGMSIDFEVRLGVNDGTAVCVFLGRTSGRIVMPRGRDGFGFDPFFEVDDLGLTLAELASDGMKDASSPRFAAVRQLLCWQPEFTTSIAEVPVWRGPMQAH